MWGPGFSAGGCEPVVVGDPRHSAGVDIRAGEVDPGRVDGLPGATVGRAVHRNDGSSRPDVVGRAGPTGVVALQVVEIGEDVAVELRCDRDEVTGNPGTWLRNCIWE